MMNDCEYVQAMLLLLYAIAHQFHVISQIRMEINQFYIANHLFMLFRIIFVILSYLNFKRMGGFFQLKDFKSDLIGERLYIKGKCFNLTQFHSTLFDRIVYSN